MSSSKGSCMVHGTKETEEPHKQPSKQASNAHTRRHMSRLPFPFLARYDGQPCTSSDVHIEVHCADRIDPMGRGSWVRREAQCIGRWSSPYTLSPGRILGGWCWCGLAAVRYRGPGAAPLACSSRAPAAGRRSRPRKRVEFKRRARWAVSGGNGSHTPQLKKFWVLRRSWK